MKRIIILLCTFFCALNMVFAQSLSAVQEKQMRTRAAQKVGQLTGYIESIANKSESLEYRLYYKNAALKLFIGQGNAYDEIHYDNNGNKVTINREGVLMEVTSATKKTRKSYLIKKYFDNLAKLNYSKVEIMTTDIAHMSVSKLNKIGDHMYKCVCFFKQSFAGYREGRPVYMDITEKKVECIIYEEETIDGMEYIVRLGDVTAVETKPITTTTSTNDILKILNQ